jgi:hypothetical protein
MELRELMELREAGVPGNIEKFVPARALMGYERRCPGPNL